MLSNPAGTSTALHPTHLVLAHPFICASSAVPQSHPIDAPWVAGIGSGERGFLWTATRVRGQYSAVYGGSVIAACRVAANKPAARDVVATFARLVTHRRVHTFRVWSVFGLCRCSICVRQLSSRNDSGDEESGRGAKVWGDRVGI